MQTNVYWLQRRLHLWAYNPGPVDGVSGPKTRAALDKFTRDFGRYRAPIDTLLDRDPFNTLCNPWIEEAVKYLGQSEIKGTRHNPHISRWWKAIRMSLVDDETPWCAAFVGAMLEQVGIHSSRSAAARSYVEWGRSKRVTSTHPIMGSVVVFWRGSPSSKSGHVGFVVGRDKKNNLMVLGGNQSDMVSIKPFDRKRVVGYYYPASSYYNEDRDLGLNNLPLFDVHVAQSNAKIGS